MGYYSGDYGCPIAGVYGCKFASGNPFTSTFVFDTTLGTLSDNGSGTYSLTGGLVSASITVTGVGSYSDPISTFNLLEWQDMVPIIAGTTDSGFETSLFFDSSAGFFQTGTCPGRPCSQLFVTSQSLTDITVNNLRSFAATPIPALGLGLPVAVLLWGWRRRR